jgi:Cof subfamily protein (haloacid dehalogenase superfamily)
MSLLAVDLDGTLLDASGEAHASDVAAIQAAIAAGVRVTIITGRLYSGSRRYVQQLALRGAIGCADGSHLVSGKDDTTLLHVSVRGGPAETLRDTFARHRAATFVFARDAIGHDPEGAPYVDYVATWSRDIRVTHDVFGHELWTLSEGVTAVVAVGTHEQIHGIVGDLQRDLAGQVLSAAFPMRRGAHAGSWAMIVRAAGGTKGTALRWIADHEGIALADTVCVGDWINDVPMFEVAGRSFAMGQAPDEVKAKATHGLERSSEQGGGVAEAIERAFGIRVGSGP